MHGSRAWLAFHQQIKLCRGREMALNHENPETIATLPGGWDLAHAIRLGIKPFAELGANTEALSGSQLDALLDSPAKRGTLDQ